MASTRAVRRYARISTSKQLRKRLRKAENQLLDASAKRDRAQARVEALSIIADELRAQLAEAEKAATVAHAKAAGNHEATNGAGAAASAAEGRATLR